MNRNLIATLVACCLLTTACVVESDPASPQGEDTISKADARKSAARADHSVDYCAEWGWYADGVCDDFCQLPDPDCDAAAHCQTDSDCGDDEYCQPGLCLFYCSVDDEDCCGPNYCVPNATPDPEPDVPEGSECATDVDCGSGEACEESICGAFCAEGATCCPLVCVPDSEPADECQSNADCGSDEYCHPGECFLYCSVDDPNCCGPNECVPN